MGKKRGRPATGHNPNFSIRIEPSALDMARTAARTRKQSLGDWLKEAIQDKVTRDRSTDREGG